MYGRNPEPQLRTSTRRQRDGLAFIIAPMASDSSLSWTNRSVLRPSREEPYLCIQDVMIFVRDLEVSLRFYVDKLGFELIADRRPPDDDADRGIHPFGGWIEVAPPDGSANLTLVAARP